MSFGSSFDTKEQIKQAIDIVDLVGSYIQLQREGRGRYKALCPWHDDSRPSLQVNPERQSFKCWVCDVGGDVFAFIMKMEGVAFPEALAMLAERAGIPLDRGGQSSGNPDEKRTLFQAMAWAEQQFHDCLVKSEEGEVARRYLEHRGVLPRTIQQFRLGFAPDSWDWILQRARQTRFTPKILETIGLVKPRRSGQGYYDFFKGRVLFSIRDVQGRPVGVGGRVLPELGETAAGKYMNSPETPLFSKSQLLYGMDVARDALAKSRLAIVMEGYTDCLIAQQCGFANVVAVLGTALGDRHVRLLRRFVDRIVLVLDGDEAGRRRADQILELFVAEQLDLKILTLPDALDPADFLLDRGKEAFQQLLDGAVDALDHKFNVATAGLSDASSTHQANKALEEVLGSLAKAPRLQSGSTSAARLKEEQMLHRLAQKFGVTEDRLRSRLTALRREGDRRSGNRSESAEPATPPLEVGKRQKAERWLMEILIQAPDLLPLMQGDIPAEAMSCVKLRSIYEMCLRLAARGIEPAFDRLLLEFDDPTIKSLIVELDEAQRARNRTELTQEIQALLQAWRQEREEEQARVQRAQSAKQPGDEAAALDVLRQIIERKRNRQGISVPTDG